MTTKYRIAEQVLLSLNKRGYDSALTFQEVMLRVNQGLAYLARNRYFVSKQTDVEEIDGSLVYRFINQDVLLDEDTLEYYVELPATTMSFPYGLGVQQVSPMKEVKYRYRNVIPGFGGLYDGLISSKLEGSIGFYQENNKLIFVNMDGTNNPDKVLLKMVLPLDGIDDDTPLNIPMDMQEECIRYLVQLYAPTPMEDTSADKIDQV